MKIGIIGSGEVGKELGKGFVKLGYDVLIGSRNIEKLKELTIHKIKLGSFNDAARFGDIIILATKWDGTKNAILLADKENFKNKIVIDVTNPLKVIQGSPPEPAVSYPNSGGKEIQSWLPESNVVKALNIVPAKYMTNPNLKQGKPVMFIAGNDPKSKEKVKEILKEFSWIDIIDFGDIRESYLLETFALIWIRYGFLNKTWSHSFKLLKE